MEIRSSRGRADFGALNAAPPPKATEPVNPCPADEGADNVRHKEGFMHQLHKHLADAQRILRGLPIPAELHADYLANERILIQELMGELQQHAVETNDVQRLAEQLAQEARNRGRQRTGVDTFLSEYSLSSDEGIVLMCLAEALIRIPDDATAIRLIHASRFDSGRIGTAVCHRGWRAMDLEMD